MSSAAVVSGSSEWKMNGNDGSCQLEGSHRDKEQKKMRLVGNSHPASTSTSTSTAAARSSQTLRSYAPMLRHEPETNRSRDTWDTQIDDHHWKMWWNYHTGKKEVTTPSSSSSFQCFFLWASLDAFGWFKIISFFSSNFFMTDPCWLFWRLECSGTEPRLKPSREYHTWTS